MRTGTGAGRCIHLASRLLSGRMLGVSICVVVDTEMNFLRGLSERVEISEKASPFDSGYAIC